MAAHARTDRLNTEFIASLPVQPDRLLCFISKVSTNFLVRHGAGLRNAITSGAGEKRRMRITSIANNLRRNFYKDVRPRRIHCAAARGPIDVRLLLLRRQRVRHEVVTYVFGTIYLAACASGDVATIDAAGALALARYGFAPDQ